MSGDLKEGAESSRGDPKVLLVLNAVLSVLFAYVVVFLSDLANVTTFSWQQVLGFALVLMLLTYVVVRE